MTREETTAMLSLLKAAYPQFYAKMNRTEMLATVDLWSEMFAEDDVNIVKYALRDLIGTHSGFPPDIAAVKAKLRDITGAALGEATDEDLWRELVRALGNGLYGAEEEFAKLSPVNQRYCGSSSTLRDLAMVDTETLNTVTHGQYLKQIKAVREREEYSRGMPEYVKQLIGAVYKPMSVGGEHELSPAEWNDRRNNLLDQIESMQYNTGGNV